MDTFTPEEAAARNAAHWATVPGDMELLAEQCCDRFHQVPGTFQNSPGLRESWRALAQFLWGLGARPMGRPR